MNPLSRRRALRLLAVTAVAPAFTRAAAPAPSALPSFDHEMQLFMTERAIPGGALAIVKDRHLIYARGYGRADRDHPAPVTATSRFRIASLSKPVTAAAVFKLIEDKKLALDDRAFTRLPLKSLLPADATPDERLARITLRQLLQHTAGWDRDKTYDPMFRTKQIATELGLAPPAGPRDIIRHHLGKPLDFDPGTRYAYSNFGYCLLGRIIEEISGETYEAFTRRAVLAPAGTRQMQLGKSPATARATDEVRYHTPDNAMGENLFAPDGPKVPWPDGGFALESMDANGGWIASVIDLARFVAALDPAAPRPSSRVPCSTPCTPRRPRPFRATTTAPSKPPTTPAAGTSAPSAPRENSTPGTPAASPAPTPCSSAAGTASVGPPSSTNAPSTTKPATPPSTPPSTAPPPPWKNGQRKICSRALRERERGVHAASPCERRSALLPRRGNGTVDFQPAQDVRTACSSAWRDG